MQKTYLSLDSFSIYTNGFFVVALWRQIQLTNFSSWEKLSLFLSWDDSLKTAILPKSSFPLNLPLRLAQKIKKNTLDDPILRQFLPVKKETEDAPGFVLDPVQDSNFAKSSKLLHKYHGRALLVVSGACAMHCRFCFRRNFNYEKDRKDFSTEIDYIRNTPSLKEIILSGGDPLSLSNEDLSSLLHTLSSIPHIRRIRFHSRFPIGIPERIDKDFLHILSNFSKQFFFVVHTNHPKELDIQVLSALKQVQLSGTVVLNQSVLLRGVNDNASILAELFETLSDHGILPYYLHQLDKVLGATHFAVPEEDGKKIMKELSSLLSGYNLPRYAKEEPGMPSKTILNFT